MSDDIDDGPDKPKAPREIPDEVFAQMRAMALGYGSPPVHSRFQKGQSGNPKGRPKKVKPPPEDKVKPIVDRTLLDLIGDKMADKVQVRRNGEIVEMTREEALTEKLFELASKGHVSASRLLLDITQQRRALKAAEAADNYAFWSDWKEQNTEWREAARARGEDEPDFYVHPEDIVLGPGHKVRIVGPRGEEERKQYAQYVLDRDYHKAFLGRSIWKWHNSRPKPQTPIPMFLSMLSYYAHEEMLPPRMRAMDTFPQWMLEQLHIGGKQSYNNLMRAAYAAGKPIPGHRFHHDPVIPDELVEVMIKHHVPPKLMLEGYAAYQTARVPEYWDKVPIPDTILQEAKAIRAMAMEALGL